MPHKDPEKRKEYTREYNKRNRQRRIEYMKKYNSEHKEKIAEHNKQYNEKNKEQIAKQQKIYNQTEAGKKSVRISRWKFKGVKCEDWDKLYSIYLSQSNCEECGIELTYNKRNTTTTKVLDHCHETGEFRNILCHACNTKRGQ